MAALLRLAEIEGGDIVIDGCSVRSVPLRRLRSALGVVPQAAFLFEVTPNVGQGVATVEDIARNAQRSGNSPGASRRLSIVFYVGSYSTKQPEQPRLPSQAPITALHALPASMQLL